MKVVNTLPQKLSLAVDMYGCPNRCKHCWLSHMPNRRMNDADDEVIVNYFKPYFDSITYYSWLREPDYCDHYRERWIRDNAISINAKPERFELASFYRLVRDDGYIRFLKEVGVKTVQLTFFGLEEMTDKYVGRQGAFKELLQATDILIENRISPRWQAFINEDNKADIALLLKLIDTLDLYERCKAFDGEFKFFVHAGSCDGENRKLYPIRINKGNVPEVLIPYFWNYDQNFSEQELCERLKEDHGHVCYNYGDHLRLQVSNQMDVYFNYTHMIGKWKIGNLKEIPAEEMIDRIVSGNVEALQMARGITVAELVENYGDKSSQKLFVERDYLEYLLNKHVEQGE